MGYLWLLEKCIDRSGSASPYCWLQGLNKSRRLGWTPANSNCICSMDAFIAIRLPALATPERNAPVPGSRAAREADEGIPDEVLIARVGEDDKEALALLFRRYAGSVRGVAY